MDTHVKEKPPTSSPQSPKAPITYEDALAFMAKHSKDRPFAYMSVQLQQDDSPWLDAIDAIERRIEENELAHGQPFSDFEDSSEGYEPGDHSSDSECLTPSKEHAGLAVFPFLSLPGELREKIYSFYMFNNDFDDAPSRGPDHDVPVVTHTKYINLFHIFRTGPGDVDGRQYRDIETDEPEFSMTKQLTLPLLQTSRLLRREALTLFHKFTCFTFDTITDLNIFLVRMGPIGRNEIRHIHLLDGFMFGGWSSASNVRVLELLGRCPNLSSLALVVDEWSVCNFWSSSTEVWREFRRTEVVLPTVDDILARPEYVALRKIRVEGEVALGYWGWDSRNTNVEMPRLMEEVGKEVISAMKTISD
jgi:hypothetical protein